MVLRVAQAGVFANGDSPYLGERRRDSSLDRKISRE